MIITCPECSTNYLITIESIGANGRKVKCAKCTHIWFATNIEVEVPTAINKEQPKFPLPAIIKNKISIWLKLTNVMLLLASLLSFMVFNNEYLSEHYAFLKEFYEKLGIFESEGLRFNELKVINAPNDQGKQTIGIEGKIINLSEHSRYIPYAKITIKTTGGQKITSETLKLADKMLAPNEEYIISNQVGLVSSQAEYMVIDIGNKLELFFR